MLRKKGIPNERDFISFCQIQYFRFIKLRKFFTHWVTAYKDSSSESTFLKVDKIHDEYIEDWTKVQTAVPRIQPPRRDSELKRFLRGIVSSTQFHTLQQCQASGLQFPDLKQPEDSKDAFRMLTIELINEINHTIEASQYFYEMYLSYIEYELNGGDEEEPGPFAIFDKVCALDMDFHEERQVQEVINFADSLLERQISIVI